MQLQRHRTAPLLWRRVRLQQVARVWRLPWALISCRCGCCASSRVCHRRITWTCQRTRRPTVSCRSFLTQGLQTHCFWKCWCPSRGCSGT